VCGKHARLASTATGQGMHRMFDSQKSAGLHTLPRAGLQKSPARLWSDEPASLPAPMMNTGAFKPAVQAAKPPEPTALYMRIILVCNRRPAGPNFPARPASGALMILTMPEALFLTQRARRRTRQTSQSKPLRTSLFFASFASKELSRTFQRSLENIDDSSGVAPDSCTTFRDAP